MTRINLQNYSTVLTDGALEPISAAIQRQAREHFAPAYGTDSQCAVVVGTAGVKSPGDWPVYIYDDSDQAGALGYHQDIKGVPTGKVFAKTDLHYGLSVSVTLSHEILEMLGDPFAATAVQFSTSTWAAFEVCDAVEADVLGYTIDGVLVSDFVLPAWFVGGAGPYSFKRHVTRPRTLAKGGYIGLWSQSTGWTQQVAKRDGVTSRSETMGRHFERACASYEMALLDVEDRFNF
jgi:hypothetical protein